jgi:Flp pilus assembly protein TadD/peroxiredoxin
MPYRTLKDRILSRRTLLKNLGVAPLLLRAAPFLADGCVFSAFPEHGEAGQPLAYAEPRFTPHYPVASDLADVLRLVPPGSDSYVTEQYAVEITAQLELWGSALRKSPRGYEALASLLESRLDASSLAPAQVKTLRSGFGIDVTQRHFGLPAATTREEFLRSIPLWLGDLQQVESAEFEVFAIDATSANPQNVTVSVRYDLVATLSGGAREERVGAWKMNWTKADGAWKIARWEAMPETLSIGHGGGFVDISQQALGNIPSYAAQMLRGVDHWRTVLDGACGPDIYANNGVAMGDFDNDGFDDIYVSQPAGLPNRLYRNRGDGTFEDVTEKARVGVLDSTACALFADFDNRGLQDLLVVCGSGPLLYRNQGDGTFALKRGAFQFATPPQGTFTHAAIADYDGDGRLDIYFCTYMYYLGLDQYHYPAPYYDARNGPPNLLLHNEGDGTFVEKTGEAGLNAQNNRYSFACAWGDSNGNGHPDLCIANDFGTSQLYRNQGDGTFAVASNESHIEDVGAGMSACWCDFDNDGQQDIYITSMWEAAGQRVSTQPQFHPDAPPHIRAMYQRHARGNALYRNLGHGAFENIGEQSGAAMGRWSWSADFWDIDHDGFPDLYVTNGYISAPRPGDVASFFWRQVVAKSPDDAKPLRGYERGWNAINELVRSDSTWNGYERNVVFANNRDGTFSEVSGVLGLDCLEDSRSFALADIDHDGRLEVILKNRNAPQLRILRNEMRSIGDSISFRLRGHRSNRDAIGACITLQCGELRQTRYVQAGSGFLAQHSKEIFFGLGHAGQPLSASIRWPSGLVQKLEGLEANHRIEIEEGNDALVATAFVKRPQLRDGTVHLAEAVNQPEAVETWLIAPLRAPVFSLPDLAGQTHSLASLQGNFVLLHLWSTENAAWHEPLRELQRHQASLVAAKLQLLAVNLDAEARASQAKELAAQERFTFPVLLADQDTAGIYNIIFRYLFDRRRDLALPTSFLLDRQGMIVKVYQGSIKSTQILEDLRMLPMTPVERQRRALPFAGVLVQDSFHRNDFTYGVALFQHGFLNQAAESFQQVVAARPNDPEAYYNLGTLNLRRNDFAEARRYLKRTLELRADYPEAWNNLGMMSAQEGHADEAIDSFNKALALRPDYATALLNLGNVYRRAGALDKSDESLRHALAIQPDDPEVNYSLGMLHAQQNQLQEAAGFLEKAIALRPSYPEALNNLGIVFVRLQDMGKAEQQFKTAIAVVPQNDQAYLNLARLYAMRNDRAAARGVLQELLKIQPQNATATRALDVLQ